MDPNEEKLATFVEDDVMFHAVKAILFSHFDLNNVVNTSEAMTEQFDRVMAVARSRNLLEEGFKDLLKFKKGSRGEKNTSNPNGV